MPLNLPGLDVVVFTLPLDGPSARDAFLRLLHSPGETWIADYGFTERDLVAEIEAADAAGVPVHLRLDRSQAAGHTESVVLAELAPSLKHGDLTVTTAGPDSTSPSQIMHSKVLVTRDPDGGEDYCWVGSVNFSESGWLQANVAFLFRSNAWARQVFVPWFERTQKWAYDHVPQPSRGAGR